MASRHRDPDPSAYPRELETQEAALLRARRHAVRHPPAAPVKRSAAAMPSWSSTLGRWVSHPKRAFWRWRLRGTAKFDRRTLPHVALPENAVGFGLSGGGIRSATLTLGLFQAIAESRLLRIIDFLSTVSGGGYFGSFLGRLFTRPWIRDVADVERVLRGVTLQTPPAPAQPNWSARVFRWLRDNGRYLAPRGSGDLLLLAATLLRNWVAVQVVLITTVLTLFVSLQLVRIAFEPWLGLTARDSRVGPLLVCGLPGASHLWWSPWTISVVVPLFAIAAPAGWAYWLIVGKADGRHGWPPWIGVVALCGVGLAGVARYTWAAHPVRFSASAAVSIIAILTLAFWLAGRAYVTSGSPDDVANRLRNGLSRTLKLGILISGALFAWALVDTLGGTLYALIRGPVLSRSAVGVFGGLAGIGAFARQVMLLLAPNKASARPTVSTSVLAWIGAAIVSTVWLVTIDVGSQAIAWNFQKPHAIPTGLVTAPQPQLLGADHLVVAPGPDGFDITAAAAANADCHADPIDRPSWHFAAVACGILAALSLLFGRTRTFANMSSIHTFYAARLTRTYLGASNEQRLQDAAIKVTDTTPTDDCAGDSYWRWPTVGRVRRGPTGIRRPYDKGGPLHILNATINETYDARTGVQNQDRKGTGLAVGPCGLSVGIRHHLISTTNGLVTRPAADGTTHAVFTHGNLVRTPEPLSLGKWTSVSGAAFSAAAGANTSVPIAILAGLFNVRLGYWWDSGTRAGGSLTLWERVIPVQAALLAETLARTRGTTGQLWNLSDGGHFENMGGYELIRRRLPIVVIVDAEADPDYTFEGLSDLVRTARLDFGAEITFLNQAQIAGTLPSPVRDYFGDLDALRRGKWKNEEVPYPAPPNNKKFTIEVDRSRVSRAHAALARVSYANADGSPPTDASWLVYVKATLMGDEPEDVCHYHRAHPEFPQETTTDQFFDERQWESYRRLGLHIGHRVLTRRLFAYLMRNPA